jgi:hypothetical protein
MKRISAVLALCAVLLAANPAFALPPYVENMIRNVVRDREFFAGFWGYERHFLHDVKRLGGGRVGVVLLTPVGFELHMVFDLKTKEMIYETTSVPSKDRREAMRRESIFVADAVKIAKNAKNSITPQ